jgi:hypothetical protein
MNGSLRRQSVVSYTDSQRPRRVRESRIRFKEIWHRKPRKPSFAAGDEAFGLFWREVSRIDRKATTEAGNASNGGRRFETSKWAGSPGVASKPSRLRWRTRARRSPPSTGGMPRSDPGGGGIDDLREKDRRDRGGHTLLYLATARTGFSGCAAARRLCGSSVSKSLCLHDPDMKPAGALGARDQKVRCRHGRGEQRVWIELVRQQRQ